MADRVKPRHRTRHQFLADMFGDQVAQCRHCAEYHLKGYVCNHCQIDPDDTQTAYIVLSWDGAESWEVSLFDKTGKVVADHYFDQKIDAQHWAGSQARVRYPRPIYKQVNKRGE